MDNDIDIYHSDGTLLWRGRAATVPSVGDNIRLDGDFDLHIISRKFDTVINRWYLEGRY